jgi:hypothetical protein
MKKLILLLATMALSSAALAQTASPVPEPVCEPIGRTAKGDLVYSILCRNIPGLTAGENGYNPLPKETTTAPSPTPTPAPPKAPESK